MTERPLVGLQIGAISFVDEGVDQVLDGVSTRAGVDALFIATQSFDRGLQGRQVPGRPWPGHGPKALDHHVGGSYVTQHPEHYRGTVIRPYRAADAEVAGRDVLADVIPAARERGMRVFSFILENTHSGLTRHVPNWPKVLQVDAFGRIDRYACLRNPGYIAWWLSLVEDQLTHYPVDGLMFGSERNGPLGNVIADGGFARDGNAYCFCRHCLDAAHRRGIDAERARSGYLELYRAVGRAGGEGATIVQFLALLLKYPEILAWEQLFHEGYTDLQKQIYGTAKFLAPDVSVGWHVWHHNSFSPLLRAQIDFASVAEYADFVKPVLYHNCGGYRMHHHIGTVGRSIFRGVPGQTLWELYCGSLGYDEGGRFDDLPATGLSTDYVRREARRTVEDVAGRAAVYPGLDVDVPTPEHVKKTDPDEIAGAVRAVADGGADGVILSRKFSEMRWENLDAVGREVTALGWRDDAR
jgi:hypothetical protein